MDPAAVENSCEWAIKSDESFAVKRLKVNQTRWPERVGRRAYTVSSRSRDVPLVRTPPAMKQYLDNLVFQRFHDKLVRKTNNFGSITWLG